jgi:hypothetical protein
MTAAAVAQRPSDCLINLKMLLGADEFSSSELTVRVTALSPVQLMWALQQTGTNGIVPGIAEILQLILNGLGGEHYCVTDGANDASSCRCLACACA